MSENIELMLRSCAAENERADFAVGEARLMVRAADELTSLRQQVAALTGVREQCAQIERALIGRAKGWSANPPAYGAKEAMELAIAIVHNAVRDIPLEPSPFLVAVEGLRDAVRLFKWDEQAGDVVLYAQPTGAGFRGRINLSASLSPDAFEAFLRVRDEQAAALSAVEPYLPQRKEG